MIRRGCEIALACLIVATVVPLAGVGGSMLNVNGIKAFIRSRAERLDMTAMAICDQDDRLAVLEERIVALEQVAAASGAVLNKLARMALALKEKDE